MEKDLRDPAYRRRVENLFYQELGNMRRILREGLDSDRFRSYSRFVRSLEAGIKVIKGFRG
jgi:hypothetical protein